MPSYSLSDPNITFQNHVPFDLTMWVQFGQTGQSVNWTKHSPSHIWNYAAPSAGGLLHLRLQNPLHPLIPRSGAHSHVYISFVFSVAKNNYTTEYCLTFSHNGWKTHTYIYMLGVSVNLRTIGIWKQERRSNLSEDRKDQNFYVKE